MLLYEPNVNPPCDYYEEYVKPKAISEKIEEICNDIIKKGSNTNFYSVYEELYDYIDKNYKKFCEEV